MVLRNQPQNREVFAALIYSVQIFNPLETVAFPLPSLLSPNTKHEHVDHHKLPQNDTPDVRKPAIFALQSTKLSQTTRNAASSEFDIVDTNMEQATEPRIICCSSAALHDIDKDNIIQRKTRS